LIRALKNIDKGKDGRAYFTQRAEKTLMRKLTFGYHFESLPLNGFRILNGRFNGIDYSDIYPNRSYLKAHLTGSKEILFNKPLLDVLGIRYIFADLNEPAPRGLVRSALLPGENGQIVIMYINPDAWPDAVVVKHETRSLKPLPENGPNNHSLLFYDFGPLENKRIIDDSVTTRRDYGSIELRLAPSNKSRTVMISEYFRPGWRAEWRSSKGMMETPVFPIFRRLMGIEIPKGAVEVKLSYSPLKKTVFLFLSLGTFIALAVIALVASCFLTKKRKQEDKLRTKNL
jgi:hypothetical protein